AFTKVFLRPGETTQISMRLTNRDFAFFDIGAKVWRREAGDFVIEAASSSVDIRARATIELPADPRVPPPVNDEVLGGRHGYPVPDTRAAHRNRCAALSASSHGHVLHGQVGTGGPGDRVGGEVPLQRAVG